MPKHTSNISVVCLLLLVSLLLNVGVNATFGQQRGSLGISKQYLRTLTYSPDDIPGFVFKGENINLDQEVQEIPIPLNSHIVSDWDSPDSAYWLRTHCRVFESKQKAQEWLDFNAARSPSAPMFKHSSLSGLPLGDDCWCSVWGRGNGFVMFVKGRVFVNITGGQTPKADELGLPPFNLPLLEGLAAGIEYEISRRPELLAANIDPQPKTFLVKGKPLKIDPAPTYASATMVPVEPTFTTLGVTTQWDKKSGALTLALGKQKVELKLGSRAMKVGGKEEVLPRPVFLRQGQPIAALEPVAKALGIRMESRSKTQIALLPPQ